MYTVYRITAIAFVANVFERISMSVYLCLTLLFAQIILLLLLFLFFYLP